MDIRSGLDIPQRRKGDNRTTVEQGLDCLSAAYDYAGNLASGLTDHKTEQKDEGLS